MHGKRKGTNMLVLKLSSKKGEGKIYHGDVLIKKETIPKDAVHGAAPDVLGWGEVAGSAHRISKGEVTFFECMGQKYMRALTEIQITHDANGHKPAVLPPGDYTYGNAREFDYEKMESARVQD